MRKSCQHRLNTAFPRRPGLPKIPPSLAIALCFAFTLFAPVSHAASVLWGPATTIAGDSDVSTVGTLSYAYYFAHILSPPPGAITLNGVEFERVYQGSPYWAASPYSIGGGDITATGSSGQVAFAWSDSASAPYSELSESYQSLLAGQLYDTTNNTLTLTLNNLSSGQDYLVQFWSNESRSVSSVDTRTGQITSGNQTVGIDYNTTNAEGGVGQWVTASFTADSTTQDFVFEGVLGDQKIPMLNAVQVRAIPEPAPVIFMLLSLPALALLRIVAGKPHGREKLSR